MTEDGPGRTVAVVGAGIGGIRAAFELAGLGYKVKLIDTAPDIGGALSRLDRQFPTDDCGFCKILPDCASHVEGQDAFGHYQACLRRELHHPNIELLPYTDVTSFEGRAGDFRLGFVRKARCVSEELCIFCGKCSEVCPVDVPEGPGSFHGPRKAVYVRHPGGSPRTYTVDRKNCNRCGECVKVCPTRAIDLDMTDRTGSMNVGAVVLAPGFRAIDPSHLAQYGFGRYPNVVTSLQFERLLSGLGPTGGVLARPSDGAAPKRIAFIQCAGSRDTVKNYCSSACCMYSMKEARLALSKDPALKISIFYMDMRAFGKDYDRYFRATREMGVEFVISRPGEINRNPDGTLQVVYSDSNDDIRSDDYDIVVLAVGQQPPDRGDELARIFDIERDEHGFCSTQPFSSVKTTRNGIYVCGSFSGPKDIPDTVTEATAISSLINRQLRGQAGAIRPGPAPDRAAGRTGEQGRLGVILCNCPDGLDLEGIERFLRSYETVSGPPGPVVDLVRTGGECLRTPEDQLSANIKDSGITRLVVGDCTPFKTYRKFVAVFEALGLDPGFIEPVDLTGCSPPGGGSEGNEAVTDRVKAQLALGVERLCARRPRPREATPITRRVLVVGWGIAGFISSLELALNDIPVDLVEKSPELGKGPTDLFSTIEGYDMRELLGNTLKQVTNNDAIRVFSGTTLTGASGQVGNFRVTFETVEAEEVGPGTEEKRSQPPREPKVWSETYGAIIVVTGGSFDKPSSYHYGEHKSIVMQTELSDLLNKDKLDPGARTFVMVQCVESRDDVHPYCSRICCIQSLRNAIMIKERDPDAEVYILYRSICAYGTFERYYIEARSKGIHFIRYREGERPEVSIKDGRLEVKVKVHVLDEGIVLKPDMVVLATGLVPNDTEVAGLLDLPRNSDGFFLEANPKYRPVDFQKPGIFVAGYAHSPKRRAEMVVQAQAAAARALSLLSKGFIEAPARVSMVNERWCSGCMACIQACPYQARYLDREARTARVVQALCRGCGICQTVCPNSAATLEEPDTGRMMELIEAGLDI